MYQLQAGKTGRLFNGYDLNGNALFERFSNVKFDKEEDAERVRYELVKEGQIHMAYVIEVP